MTALAAAIKKNELKVSQPLISYSSRPTLRVNLENLRYNYQSLKKRSGNAKIGASVKADAYGHGLVRVANELSDTDAFGVACLEEGIELRDAGIDKPVILLEGPYSEEELVLVEKLNFEMVIHHSFQIGLIYFFSICVECLYYYEEITIFAL